MKSNCKLGIHAAALVAVLGLAACSSDGRVAFAGGAGLGSSGAGNGSGSNGSGSGSGGSGSGTNNTGGSGSGSGGGTTTPASASSSGTLDRIVDGADDALASSGNAGSVLGQSGRGVVGDVRDTVDQTGLVETADNRLNPLARVSVGDDTLVGSGASSSNQALGVSVLSPTQTEGDVASLGVLSNGQVVAAAANVAEGASTNGLLGVAAGDSQVIGGANNAIAVGVLTPTNEQGSAVSANVLSSGDVLNAQVAAPEGGQAGVGGAVETVTGIVQGALPGTH